MYALVALAGAIVAILTAIGVVRRSSGNPEFSSKLDTRSAARGLIVFAHGLFGRTPTKSLLQLIRAEYPNDDVMTFDYHFEPSGRVRNLACAPGGHGTGVDMSHSEKLAALTDYIVTDNFSALETLRTAAAVNPYISFFSNVSWFVWLGLITILALIDYGLSLLGWPWVAGYAVLLFALLNSV